MLFIFQISGGAFIEMFDVGYVVVNAPPEI
jgi:hypothetical protein